MQGSHQPIYIPLFSACGLLPPDPSVRPHGNDSLQSAKIEQQPEFAGEVLVGPLEQSVLVVSFRGQ